MPKTFIVTAWKESAYYATREVEAETGAEALEKCQKGEDPDWTDDSFEDCGAEWGSPHFMKATDPDTDEETDLDLEPKPEPVDVNAELLSALQNLLDAPDLNLGNLEEETITAVEAARTAVLRATGKQP